MKAPPLDLLSLNARIVVAGERDRFSQLADGRFAVTAHLAGADDFADDFVAVAERFLGAPYLWGGRTSIGLDCSGLVQLALQAAGIACPRDTDMLEKSVGAALPDTGDLSGLQRGDLVFWKGHVGVMLDEKRLLHANAFHMAVAVEPLSEAVARIAEMEGPVTSVRRLGDAE
jgi:cell wall-associated NlpC family hydrolase